jgi:hypothetical protein
MGPRRNHFPIEKITERNTSGTESHLKYVMKVSTLTLTFDSNSKFSFNLQPVKFSTCLNPIQLPFLIHALLETHSTESYPLYTLKSVVYSCVK